MEFNHKSVLLEESVDALQIKPDGIYIDGTAGGAGHSRLIAGRLTTGRLIAIDKDPDAVAVATERLKPFSCAEVVQADFGDFDNVLDERGIGGVDGVLLDLGVSSHQLDVAERGFSYHKDAPLDMRMSRSGTTAGQLVNTLSVDELTRIIREYGEDKFAFRIAKAIDAARRISPIETTLQLSDIISGAVPAAARRDGHPARRTFQALRIAVNGELDSLSAFLDKAVDRLNKGGVIAIISFHSLEDRMVKQRFNEWCTGCVCPPDFPVCVCGKNPLTGYVFKKPVMPSADQINENFRTHSAKLRAVYKL